MDQTYQDKSLRIFVICVTRIQDMNSKGYARVSIVKMVTYRLRVTLDKSELVSEVRIISIKRKSDSITVANIKFKLHNRLFSACTS